MGPEIIFYALAILIALVLLGVHIGVALGFTSMLGVFMITGSAEVALSLLASTSFEAIRSHSLAVIPLFVLMGEFISRSHAASDLFRICDRRLSRLPGRLAAATVIGNTAFAAVSGVAIASAATFSRIAYPEMRRVGYDNGYALGVIAGSACLGMLIPPSVLLIVWAILTEGSVGKLFLGGVGPGLLLGFIFVLYCVVAAIIKPGLAPPPDREHEAAVTPASKKSELIGGLGIAALVVIVLGGIWGGYFTPTEAAGFGVLGSALIGWIKGMRYRDFMESIYDAGRTTAPIMFLLVAGSMYARLLAMSGGINMIQDFFATSGMSLFSVILLMTVVWLILGAIIDSISVILMTVPIFVPIAIAAGFDEIAFAIFGILVIEAGLLTPPVGLLVFTVKAAVPEASVTLSEVFKGAVPYMIMILVVAFVVLAFPALASWLPNKFF